MIPIGKLFGAKVFVSIYVDHDTILISPKEERLFAQLMELEKEAKKRGKIVKVGAKND